MTARTFTITIGAVLLAASASAHVAMAPQQSTAGASQVYKLRVHNEEKTAVRSVELDIPAGVAVQCVAPLANATIDSLKQDGRITTIIWKAEVAPARYVELAFTATNPDMGDQLAWNVRERFADGSVTEWSDKPAAKLKASVTKLTPKP
jgi:uncharacterized protein YcnI